MTAPPATANQFVVMTAGGDVLVNVHGSADGINNASLARLIQAGVSEHYAIRCAGPADVASAHARLDWHVTDVGPKSSTAMVTARLVRDEHPVAAVSTEAISPHAAPETVFISDVGALAQRIIPPGVAENRHPAGCQRST